MPAIASRRWPTSRRTEEAIAAAAVDIGPAVGASALVAFTQTGTTPQRVAAHRSPVPLFAFTPDPAVRSRLALTWGVETFVVPPAAHTDDMVRTVEDAMLRLGRAAPGDLVVLVAGTPPGAPGNTNTIRVHRLGSG